MPDRRLLHTFASRPDTGSGHKTESLMKIKSILTLIMPLLAGVSACDDFALCPDEQLGELRWILDSSVPTKSSGEIPDTNDFILTIRDADGKTLYEGSYGDSPEYLPVQPGNYTIGIVSIPFKAPAFSEPQYGDVQVAVVPSGGKVTVRLQCTLLNAGIRLKIAFDFLSTYPGGVLFVRQDSHQLKYGYYEKRIAYVFPGEVSVLLSNEGRDEILFTRRLNAREILSLSISAPAPGNTGSSVAVAVDTTKNWTADSLVIGGEHSGGGNGGEDWQKAISVAEAPAHSGEKGVWVYGYIVGGDLSSAGKNVKTEGFSKNTHIALADRSSITTKSSCIAVELPKGDVRDALNLVAHPELRGKRVYVKGNIVDSYFGTTGLKGTSAYRLP